jgi:phage-related holin
VEHCGESIARFSLFIEAAGHQAIAAYVFGQLICLVRDIHIALTLADITAGVSGLLCIR